MSKPNNKQIDALVEHERAHADAQGHWESGQRDDAALYSLARQLLNYLMADEVSVSTNTVAAQLLTATRRERDEALMNLKQSEFAVTLCRRRAERAETERDAALHKLKCMRELHGEEAWETLSVYAEQVRNEDETPMYQPGIGKTAFINGPVIGRLHR